jgi:hypothetical protein
VCGAIGVEFLIRHGTVGPQGLLPSFRQERSLQCLVTEVCGVLIQDLPLGNAWWEMVKIKERLTAGGSST